MDPAPPSIISPPTAPHTHTVVFLHGRGDKVANFVQALDYWKSSSGRTLQELYPSFRWVFPQAPQSRPVANPSQIWPQWFDIWNTSDFSQREEYQAEGLRVSVDRIHNILADEAKLLGGRWDRIILAGISQGAATSVHTLINLSIPQTNGDATGPRGLAAFLGFSCRMPFPGRSLQDTRKILHLANVPEHAEVLKSTPMLLEHCVDDPLVLIQNGRGLRDSLRGFGAQVDWKEYPNGGHWFNLSNGVDDVAEFLNRVVMPKKGPDVQSDSSAMDLS